MTAKVNIQDITAGYRVIVSGKQYDRFFTRPDVEDRIILDDGDVDDTVDLMKRVVWKYIDDTKLISKELAGNTINQTCNNIWNFLYNHIQYRLDKKGVEQLRRPVRSWAERHEGIDCDCFSIFVSSILTNLQIPHTFRITKYGLSESFQHVYVIVPRGAEYITIDCVLNQYNYEKPYSQKKDFTMNMNGINVAVLSGIDGDVFDLISGLEGLGELAGQENDRAIFEHLLKTRTMVAQNPQAISTVDNPEGFLKMLDYAIEHWNTPNRAKALEILAQNEDKLNELNGFDEYESFEGLFGLEDENEFEDLGAAKRKAKKGVKKGFFKKVGAAVKKGGKAFIRFNPITISARGGFLLALKMNLKKMSSKLQWAYKSKEEAKKNGVSESQWNKTKNALKNIEKLFVKTLQGKPAALKKAILNHRKGGMHGLDDEFAGLGIAPAAALAAAVPVITKAIKTLVDSGIMKKEEADNLQAEINAQTKDVSPDEIKEFEESSGSGDGGSGDEKGIMAFVKKQPLVVAGGAALGIWGLTKLMGNKKKKQGSLSGVKSRKTRAKRKPTKSARKRVSVRKLQ